MIDQLAHFTGLSKEVIDEANLRINVQKFTHYLLIDQKLRVGRLDGALHRARSQRACWTRRFTIRLARRLRPPFTSVFNNYLAHGTGIQGRHALQRACAEHWLDKWDWGSAIKDFRTRRRRCGRRL